MSAYNCIFLTRDCIFLLISSASLFPGLSVPFQQALPQQVRVNSWWPLNVLHYRTCGAPAAAGAGRPRPAARGRGWHACARGKPLPAAVRLTGRQRGAASVAAAAASAVCCRCCSLLPGRRRWPPASIAAAVVGRSGGGEAGGKGVADNDDSMSWCIVFCPQISFFAHNRFSTVFFWMKVTLWQNRRKSSK